jgi:hypothetical protein
MERETTHYRNKTYTESWGYYYKKFEIECCICSSDLFLEGDSPTYSSLLHRTSHVKWSQAITHNTHILMWTCRSALEDCKVVHLYKKKLVLVSDITDKKDVSGCINSLKSWEQLLFFNASWQREESEVMWAWWPGEWWWIVRCNYEMRCNL